MANPVRRKVSPVPGDYLTHWTIREYYPNSDHPSERGLYDSKEEAEQALADLLAREQTREQTPQQKADALRARVQKVALADLDAIAQELTEDELREVTDYLDGQIQYQTRVWSYLQARYRGSHHDGAVKEQNKAIVHVRRMIGYTRQRSDINF